MLIRGAADSRAFLDASYRSLLRTYVLSAPVNPAPVALVALLEAPRIRLVDLGYLDDASGSTLLHEAARRKDLRVIELAVRAGADVFVRDRRGKSVADAAGKDDRVKTFLRQCERGVPGEREEGADALRFSCEQGCDAHRGGERGHGAAVPQGVSEQIHQRCARVSYSVVGVEGRCIVV